MSNRVKTGIAKRLRKLRNRTKGPASVPMLRKGDGDLARSEGARNYAYEPRPGSSPSLLTLHKHATTSTSPSDLHELTQLIEGFKLDRDTLSQMTRDELRAEAKRLGIKGYSKLKKDELVTALVNR